MIIVDAHGRQISQALVRRSALRVAFDLDVRYMSSLKALLRR